MTNEKGARAPFDPSIAAIDDAENLALRAKADFVPVLGGWIDPNYFGKKQRAKLAEIAGRSRLSADHISGLIEFTNWFSQTVDHDGAPNAKQRAELRQIVEDCSRLLDAMERLSRPTITGFLAHTEYLVRGSTHGIELPTKVRLSLREPRDKMLSRAWDWVDALRVSACYAASQIGVSKQEKPDQRVARGLVAMVAEHLLRTTGKLPPKSSESWFSAYMIYVGEQLHLPIGQIVVKSGIELVRG